MSLPGHVRALFAAVTAAMVLALLVLGALPSATRVERTAAVTEPGRTAGGRDEPEPATTTTTEGPAATFGPGLHEVGQRGIRPGVYVTSSELCSWERRGSNGELVATDTGSGQVLVDVRTTDASFSSAPGCGTWQAFDEDGGPGTALSSFGPGTFAVGAQVAPGRWRSDGGDLCYWERLRGLGGGLDELVASAGVPGPTEVVVSPPDVAFSSFGCGTWRPVG
jgi:hypothetical protein